MKTDKLIAELNDIRIDHSLSEDHEHVVEEIIERLKELDELKDMLKSIVHIVSDFGCIDDFGNFIEL